jgi:hypothetical protein
MVFVFQGSCFCVLKEREGPFFFGREGEFSYSSLWEETGCVLESLWAWKGIGAGSMIKTVAS